MSQKLLFYTAATGFYHNFIAPYALFASHFNKEVTLEFLVWNVGKCKEMHGKALEAIEAENNCKIILRNRPKKLPPLLHDNSLRFLVPPKAPVEEYEFIYIGDIDIFITQNICKVHAGFVDSELPYSNICRPGCNKLTGLHFARTKYLYPLPKKIKQYSELVDEEILYKIYELNGHLYKTVPPEIKNIGRPTCGIHLSVNRLPFSDGGRPGWSLGKQLEVANQFLRKESSLEIINLMSKGSRRILLNILVLAEGVKHLEKPLFKAFFH